jgi:hypothetical protein
MKIYLKSILFEPGASLEILNVVKISFATMPVRQHTHIFPMHSAAMEAVLGDKCHILIHLLSHKGRKYDWQQA